jgi:hypothetical protein
MEGKTMSDFMQKQVVYDRWFEVETHNGTQYIQQDFVGMTLNPDYSELVEFLDVTNADDIYSCRVVDGYGARLSAPGYLDCTEWTVFETKEDALSFLDEFYGD